MSDRTPYCPRCRQEVPVVWVGNTLLYRPHNRPDGSRCRNSNEKTTP